MSGRRSFQYRPRTIEDVQQRRNELDNDSPGVVTEGYKTFKPRPGSNWIRLLPGTWEGARHWAFDTWVHFGVGPERATVICNAKMHMGRCFGCEETMRLERQGADDQAIGDSKSRRRAACWLIDRNAEEEGLQIWLMPGQLDLDIQEVSIDKTNGQLYLVDDPHNGFDVTFNKTGKQKQTRYAGPALIRTPSAIHPEYLQYVIDNPIPECLIYRSYEDVRELYSGGMDMGQDQPPTAPYQPQMMPPRGGQPPAMMPPRGAPVGGGYPPAGYPPSGPPQQTRAAPVQRRALGVGAPLPPQQTAIGPSGPPMDYYQGEQYQVDPNYPPPAVSEDDYYNADPAAYQTGNGRVQGNGQLPQWNIDPNAVNYGNPPSEYNQPPQQHQQQPPQRAPLPQRRSTIPPQQQMGQQPVQYPVQQPQQNWNQPGRGAPPMQQPPMQRGSTAAADTAAQLRQRFPQR